MKKGKIVVAICCFLGLYSRETAGIGHYIDKKSNKEKINAKILGSKEGVVSYKNTVFSNTFLFPELQTALCYGRTLGKRHTLYAGLSYLDNVLLLNKKASKDYIYSNIWEPDKTGIVANYLLVSDNLYHYNSWDDIERRGYNTRFIDNLGLVMGYQYALSKTSRRVLFFAEASANFTGYKLSGERWKSLRVSRTYHQLAFNLGISMKVRFLKHFYYYQNLGAGVDYIFINDLDSKQKINQTGLYPQILNLGLGYNF